MSKAAEDAAWWAAFQSKLGVLGFVAVVLSLFFTGWAARAATIAAKAAQDSIKAASDTAERQLRAYLFIVTVTPVVNMDGWHVSLELKNTGQTPANDVAIKGRYRFAEGVPVLEYSEKDRVPGTAVIGPGQIHIAKFRLQWPTPGDTHTTLARCAKDELALIAHGEVAYRDAFGLDRETHFNFRIFGNVQTKSAMARAEGPGNKAT
jgi:hypothetical protein